MKKSTFLSALACAMLWATNAVAEMKTYDLVKADEGTTLAPTYGETVSTGGVDLQLISVDGDTFDNRIAVGPTNRNNGTNAGFIFRTAGDWKGLWSQYNNRNISVLNLKKGNKVTFVISKDAETLQIVGGETIVSGKEYVVVADGNMDLVTTGGVYIESITIDDAEDAVIPESNGYGTYNFVVAPEGSIVLPTWGDEVTSGDVTLNMLASSSNTYDNRFATGPVSRNNESGNCFKFRTAGDWKGLWSQYADRNISILNLMKGDKVTFVISKEDQTLKFVDGDVIISGVEYTAEADGNMNLVTTGSVYIESITISSADDTTTAITDSRRDTITADRYYNLQGIEVAQPTRGLYIVNGKKVMVK